MWQTRIAALLPVFLLLISLSACGDQRLYKEAQESFEKGDYSKAKTATTTLINNYPKSKYASLAQEILQKIDAIEAEKQRKQAEEQRKKALERAGYKDAKWGMSPKEVKKALGVRVVKEGESSDGDYSITFDKVTCWFYKNKFYHAEYEPKLRDNDTEGFRAVVRALEEKYGGGRELKDQVDALLGTPLLIYLWEDELTKIKLRMLDPESFAKYGGGVFPSSTLKIIYENKELKAEKEDEESQKEHNKMEKRKESIKDDL